MTDLRDDFLSALWGACTSLAGRASLFVFAWVLGIVAAHATALGEFVWPWEVLWAAIPLFLIGFVFSWWGSLISFGLVALFALFLTRDIHWGFALIPLVPVWLLTHSILRAFAGF